MNGKYDIFISYRREGGKGYARTIQQALEKEGCKAKRREVEQ